MNEIAVFVKAGKIVVDYSAGNLKINAINLASSIRKLPAIDNVSIRKDGTLIVSLSCVRDIALIQHTIAGLANEAPTEEPKPVDVSQPVLFSF